MVQYKPGVELGERYVADIINPERMDIKAAFNESDFHFIKQEMPVEINLSAFPNKTFTGRLDLLGEVGNDKNKIDPTVESNEESGVTMFNGNITFDGKGLSFNPGMSAMIHVIYKQADSRLLIPREYVTFNNKEFWVQKKNNLVKIKGQVFDHYYFHVQSGIKEGDVIN